MEFKLKNKHRRKKPTSLESIRCLIKRKEKVDYKGWSKDKLIHSLKIKNGQLQKQTEKLQEKVVNLILENNYLKRRGE